MQPRIFKRASFNRYKTQPTATLEIFKALCGSACSCNIITLSFAQHVRLGFGEAGATVRATSARPEILLLFLLRTIQVTSYSADSLTELGQLRVGLASFLAVRRKNSRSSIGCCGVLKTFGTNYCILTQPSYGKDKSLWPGKTHKKKKFRAVTEGKGDCPARSASGRLVAARGSWTSRRKRRTRKRKPSLGKNYWTSKQR